MLATVIQLPGAATETVANRRRHGHPPRGVTSLRVYRRDKWLKERSALRIQDQIEGLENSLSVLETTYHDVASHLEALKSTEVAR